MKRNQPSLDLLYAAAGEVARMRMIEEAASRYYNPDKSYLPQQQTRKPANPNLHYQQLQLAQVRFKIPSPENFYFNLTIFCFQRLVLTVSETETATNRKATVSTNVATKQSTKRTSKSPTGCSGVAYCSTSSQSIASTTSRVGPKWVGYAGCVSWKPEYQT